MLSAAILIGAEVFGAAYAGGWAVAMLLGLGDYGVLGLRVVFFVVGLAVMVAFIRQAQRVEPFTHASVASPRARTHAPARYAQEIFTTRTNFLDCAA